MTSTIEDYIVKRIEVLEQDNSMLSSEVAEKTKAVECLQADINYLLGLFVAEDRGDLKVYSAGALYEAYEPEDYARLCELKARYEKGEM